jgi:putative ABC transport system permease protein
VHIFHYLSELITASFRRILARKLTALAAILGLTLASALILSISLYADGVYYQSFLENVAKTRENPEAVISEDNPTFPFLFHYFGGWHGTKTWQELAPLDDYFSRRAVRTLAIPATETVKLFSSDDFHLFPQVSSSEVNSLYLTRTSFGTMTNLNAQVTLIAGEYPQPDSVVNSGSPLEVLVSENLARKARLDVGQDFLANFKTLTASGTFETEKIPVRIAGIWRATDPAEDYWIFAPSYYENLLFMPAETFFGRLASQFPDLVFNAYWYLIMDADYVHADEIGGLIQRIDRMERGANRIQEKLWLSISPKEALKKFSDEARLLRILLYAFSIPVVGLIVAFIGLVSQLSTEQRRNEIAVIRSRGASQAQILGFTGLDGGIMGIIALGLSLPIAMWITPLIGMTRSFSDFSATSGLRLSLSSGEIQIGLFVVAVFLGMLLFPTARAAQHTIISYKGTQTRAAHSPGWQRIGLDLMLFVPAAYGAFMLQKQGGLAIGGAENLSGDPFRNPLLFLVPSLGILSLSLFSLRLIRPIMTALDYLVSASSRVGLVMAIRQIARRPSNYYTPLLILTLTMSLFAYTAALTTTFDQALYDQEFYRVGADIRFFDPGDSSQVGGTYAWDFFPVHEYTRLDGIEAAGRLGRYAAQINTARVQDTGIFMGIDRLSFPNAVFWRDDFADQPLGHLMNLLAEDPAGVIVNTAFIQKNGLQIGDTIRAKIKTYNTFTDLDLKIAGSVKYFPTWYPDQGPLLLGNLEYLFETAGGSYPYHVVLKTEPGIDTTEISTNNLRILDQKVRPVDWSIPLQSIINAQSAPERQGLVGFLFIGFITTVLLTVLAFILHLVFNFQQRTIELGVLRAGGLSTQQMISILVWEFTFLILLGGSVGTGLGVLASRVFIPHLQIGAGAAAQIPPFQVMIPWEAIAKFYWLFGGLFLISVFVSVILLRRIKIFEVIKLGETV